MRVGKIDFSMEFCYGPLTAADISFSRHNGIQKKMGRSYRTLDRTVVVTKIRRASYNRNRNAFRINVYTATFCVMTRPCITVNLYNVDMKTITFQ